MKPVHAVVPLIAGASVFGAVPSNSDSQASSQQRPNVVFFILDDLLPRLNCYGQTEMSTPNIDRLARNGMVFDNAYCQFAVCGPSRASFLSGLRPDTTRCFNNNHLQLRKNVGPDLVTLPQHFKNNGYYTLAVGKVFHHSSAQPGEDPDSWSRPSFHPGGKGYRHYFEKEALDDIAKQRAELKAGKRKRVRGMAFEAGDGISDDRYPDGLVVAQVKSRLDEIQAQGKPFFLAVGFQKPHIPYTCPKKYWDLYPEESIKLESTGLPENSNPYMAGGGNEFSSYSNIPKTGEYPESLQKNLIRGYKACVSFADAQLGRVMEALKERKMLDNTIIVMIGDNGYHFGDHATWGKMTNFERGTRVPMIVYAPGMKGVGQHSQALVELVDLAPTLTELAGLPPHAAFEGFSFKPLLDNPGLDWKDAVYSQYERNPQVMGYTVRTPQYRYVQWRKKSPKEGTPPTVVAEELYDHAKDPSEMKNVAEDPAYAKIHAELKEKLIAGWKSSLPTVR